MHKFNFIKRCKKNISIYNAEEMTSSPKEQVYSKKIMQKNECDEGSTELFLLQQPTPIDFVYPSSSGQSCDNPYVTQAAYNPSYKLALNDIVGYSINENNDDSKINEKNTSAEAKDTRIETCITYCIIGVVILIITGVIIGIVYFLIQHPKLAHALHKAIEAEKDDKDASSLKKVTATANELANKTSTFKSSYDNDERSF
ncbi:uncharacterized protein [Linepithema humile]|uniref:uncharacterized protein n=1 Tax=Linepithema humile TaxID=83485 RepID=UPI000623AD96|nr:PREDICTED: uncharacterized protein LOC105678060 [Linepithema humile]